jgi:hypothetical protein
LFVGLAVSRLWNGTERGLASFNLEPSKYSCIKVPGLIVCDFYVVNVLKLFSFALLPRITRRRGSSGVSWPALSCIILQDLNFY